MKTKTFFKTFSKDTCIAIPGIGHQDHYWKFFTAIGATCFLRGELREKANLNLNEKIIFKL